MATAPLTLRVRTREFEEGQLARVRGRLMRKLDRPISRDDLEQQLDFEEAEVLSQIASRKDHRLLWREGELRLEPCDPKEEADLERMAVVIKGSQ